MRASLRSLCSVESGYTDEAIELAIGAPLLPCRCVPVQSYDWKRLPFPFSSSCVGSHTIAHPFSCSWQAPPRWFVHQRKGTQETSLFLLKRGLWLIAVECIIVTFGWLFNPTFPIIGLQVIWAIGVSMVVLLVLVRLPLYWVGIIGAVLVFGHNALDSLHFENALWSFLHDRGRIDLFGHTVIFAYPVTYPRIRTMALGFSFGTLYSKGYSSEVRRRLLLRLGLAVTFLFIALRALNEYGDPSTWSV